MEEVELAEVLAHLVKEPLTRRVYVKFSNPDINYLLTKTGLDHKVVARCLRIFGEAVVVESLRRFFPGWHPGVFVGICRNVEAAGGGLAPRDAAAASSAGLQSPPASPPEET